MLKIQPDFFDKGRWFQRSNVNGKYTWTVSGVLWNNIKERTTEGSRTQVDEPTYIGSVNAFANFQNFVEWNRKQIGYAMGYDLDADLLKKERKIYSEESCLLLPKQLNRFLQSSGNKKRKQSYLPTGILEDIPNRLMVRCQSITPFGKMEEFRVFKSFEIEKAKEYFKDTKNKYLSNWINILSEITIDPRVISELRKLRFDYYPEGFGWRKF